MSLDDIRKLAAEERATTEKATPGPWWAGAGVIHTRDVKIAVVNEGPRWPSQDPQADAEHIARSRTAVPALCDAVESLLAVVEHLPRCEGRAGCDQPATRNYAPPGHREFLCDKHDPLDPLFVKFPYRRKHLDDLPYATALRALLTKGSPR